MGGLSDSGRRFIRVPRLGWPPIRLLWSASEQFAIVEPHDSLRDHAAAILASDHHCQAHTDFDAVQEALVGKENSGACAQGDVAFPNRGEFTDDHLLTRNVRPVLPGGVHWSLKEPGGTERHPHPSRRDSPMPYSRSILISFGLISSAFGSVTVSTPSR